MHTEAEAREKWCNRLGRPADDYPQRYPLSDKIEALSVPEPNSGCLLWVGALTDQGYGRVKVRGRFRRAHIVAYEQRNGAVPAGLSLDHLCRVRCCVNPTHLEPVSLRENLRRGAVARGLNVRAEAC